MNKLIVSSSPHFREKIRTNHIMLAVVIAMLPAVIASVVFFGLKAVTVLVACVISCALFEAVYIKLMKKPMSAAFDLSSVVTGILLAFSLPPGFPIWMCAVGSFVSIIIVKQLFGGIGKNFANPAIVGRIVLMLSFGNAMTIFPKPFDTVAGATPLGSIGSFSYMDLFLGNVSGSLGEVCKVALLAGGILLIVLKIITPTMPLAVLGSVAVFSLIFGQDPLAQILSGGVMLVAFFMATDYVTSPTSEIGKIIFGVGVGFITMLVRVYAGSSGSLTEGVSYGVLLMNILTPYIDLIPAKKPLGGVFSE